MEILKNHSKAIIICSVILVLIIVLFVVKVDPINFNDLYSDLDEEYWCTIADDGSWMKITLWHNSIYLDHVELINEDLGFSSAVYEEMMDTRAIDGRLTAKGKNVKASWSYDGSELSILYEADGNSQSLFENYAGVVVWCAVMLVCIIGVGYYMFGCNKSNDVDESHSVDLLERGHIDSNDIIETSENETGEGVPISSDAQKVDTQQSSPADELLKWKQLLDMGAITQEEFDAKKKELLGL